MQVVEHSTASAFTFTSTVEGFVGAVRQVIVTRLDRVRRAIPGRPSLAGVSSGKMLRTRMVGYLACHGVPGFDWETAVATCAATELVHSASLCHDDIIDEADVRRGVPTVWRRLGVPGAILVGDMLIVEAFGAVAEADHAGVAADFARTLSWVCRAEMDQELRHRGQTGDATRWQDVCEGKTGALFAFPIRWACPRDEAFSRALHRSALLLGTAYQMYDDVLDAFGDEARAGKSLGCDAKRGKHTIPAVDGERRRTATATIEAVMAEAVAALDAWPTAREAIEAFIGCELRPCFSMLLDSVGSEGA